MGRSLLGARLSVRGRTAALLAVALFAGRVAADVAPEDQRLGMLTAFAAGAVLASLADTLMPEAYAEGGPVVAFATSGGFSSPTHSRRPTDGDEAVAANRHARIAAVDDAQRGSSMAATPGMLRAIPTSKETR